MWFFIHRMAAYCYINSYGLLADFELFKNKGLRDASLDNVYL